MDNNYDNLKRLFDNLKTLGFWSRLFSWSKIKNQLIDASADIQKLLTNNENLQSQSSFFEQSLFNLTKDLKITNDELIKKQAEIDRLNESANENTANFSILTSDLASAKTTIKGQQIRINELTSDNRLYTEKNEQLIRDNKKLSENEATQLSVVFSS